MPALRAAPLHGGQCPPYEMPEYRRIFVPGGTFFFTLVTHDRQPLLADASNVARLRLAIRNEREQHPFNVEAAVILPDHAHFVWTMPETDSDYSSRIGRIKAAFTKSLGPRGADESPLLPRGYAGIW